MAIHAHSTPVPGFQRRLLRAARLLSPGPVPVPTPALTAETIAALEVATAAQPFPVPDPESTAVQPCNASGLAPEGALASTAAQGLLPDAEARAIYSRRRLGEALEFGFALLDALDLPPLALDVIDDAIAALDALEAVGEDLEDDGSAEAEPDGEPSIGWPNDFRAQLDPGRNWEADCDCEAVDEDGSDDGREDHGWFAGEFDVPQVVRGMVEDVRRQPALLHG